VRRRHAVGGGGGSVSKMAAAAHSSIPAVYMYIAKLQILRKSAHHIEKLGSFVGKEETF